jgi:hypothetical protein
VPAGRRGVRRSKNGNDNARQLSDCLKLSLLILKGQKESQ